MMSEESRPRREDQASSSQLRTDAALQDNPTSSSQWRTAPGADTAVAESARKRSGSRTCARLREATCDSYASNDTVDSQCDTGGPASCQTPEQARIVDARHAARRARSRVPQGKPWRCSPTNNEKGNLGAALFNFGEQGAVHPARRDPLCSSVATKPCANSGRLRGD